MKSKRIALAVLLVTAVMLITPLIPQAETFAAAQSRDTSVEFTGIIGNGTVAILNQSYLSGISSTSLTNFLTSTFARSGSYLAIIYGAQSLRGGFYEDWNVALSENNMRMPVGLASQSLSSKSLEVSSSMLNDTAVAIAFNPFGEIVGGNISLSQFPNFVSYAVTTFYKEMSILGAKSSTPIMAPRGIPMGVTPNYFNGIGFVGWYQIQANYTGSEVGWVQALWTYYEYTYTSPNGTVYYEFASIGTTSIQALGLWVPGDLWAHTGWNTSTYPGQILYAWNPVNTGSYSNGQNITYSVSVQYGPASVYVSETVPQNIITWTDQSNPSDGNAKVDYTFGSKAQGGVTYTLYPGSTGFLDPFRTGGTQPMIVTEGMYASFAYSIFLAWTPVFQQQVYLYQSSINT